MFLVKLVIELVGLGFEGRLMVVRKGLDLLTLSVGWSSLSTPTVLVVSAP